MNKRTTNDISDCDKIEELLHFFRINQKEFAEKCGVIEDSVSKIKRGKQGISKKIMGKIINAFPEVNRNWLILGEGPMINSGVIQKISDINESKFIGQMHGGSVVVNENGGKDEVIKSQGEHVVHTYDTLCAELNRFHEVSMNKDEYIKKQDSYIDRIVKHSYERNERNMERIDQLMRQQNELIQIIDKQSKKIQDCAERILQMLETELIRNTNNQKN